MRKMNTYYYLAILCTIGAMVFTYLASQKDGEKAEKALKETIDKHANEIKELSQQNIKLSDVIYSDTQEITAKGSHPITLVVGGAENGNQRQISVFLHGEYAIENLTVKIVVTPDYPDVSGLDINVSGMFHPTTEIGTLRQSEGRSYMVVTKTKYTAVTLYFNSNNNSWKESIRIVKTDNGWDALRYIQDKDGNVLYKQMDKGFPVDDKENVIIWSNVKKKFDEI
jgi:hypothetical protein